MLTSQTLFAKRGRLWKKALIRLSVSEKYSLPFRDWDVIAILRDDGVFREITEYSGRTGEMDFRLKLDHRSFKRSGKEAREKMIFELLHRSLLIVRGMSVAGADFDRFVSDVVAVARARGWVL